MGALGAGISAGGELIPLFLYETHTTHQIPTPREDLQKKLLTLYVLVDVA